MKKSKMTSITKKLPESLTNAQAKVIFQNIERVWTDLVLTDKFIVDSDCECCEEKRKFIKKILKAK